MRVHVIIDFMHIYYKYYFQAREGKIKRLSSPLEWKGSTIEKETTLIYYPLKDIERIRETFDSNGHDVTLSVCFDMKSHRTDADVAGGDEYKANRKNRLTQEDFDNINYTKELLNRVGHNTYRIDGYEADDLVNNLVSNYKDDFDYTVIYTNDKDLFVNICDNVGIMRFKVYKGYESVDSTNYETYLEQEFKTFIPYNAISLFLASVGDSADGIKGIHRFGAKAFGKLITKVASSEEINWKECGDKDKMLEVVNKCEKFLEPEQFEQLKIGFNLVANLSLNEKLDFPSNKSSKELRLAEYGKAGFKSLI